MNANIKRRSSNIKHESKLPLVRDLSNAVKAKAETRMQKRSTCRLRKLAGASQRCCAPGAQASPRKRIQHNLTTPSVPCAVRSVQVQRELHQQCLAKPLFRSTLQVVGDALKSGHGSVS